MMPLIVTHNQSISYPHGFRCVFRDLGGPIRRPAIHLWCLALFQHSALYRALSSTRDAGLDKTLHPSLICVFSKVVNGAFILLRSLDRDQSQSHDTIDKQKSTTKPFIIRSILSRISTRLIKVEFAQELQ